MDPKLQRFMPHPAWLERDWVKSARLDFEARQVAKRLMTPERLAKQEPLTLVNGAVRVGPVVGEIIQRPGPRHRVGCEEGYYRRSQPRGELAPVAGIRSRKRGDFAQTVLSYSDVDHRRRSGRCAAGMRPEESRRSLSLRQNSFRQSRGAMSGRRIQIRAGAQGTGRRSLRR
jgi:hypothetical protein